MDKPTGMTRQSTRLDVGHIFGHALASFGRASFESSPSGAKLESMGCYDSALLEILVKANA